MRYEAQVSILGDPTPTPSLSCPPGADLCHYIYQQTGLPWLATSGYYLLVKPLKIALIVLFALIIRYLVHRMINKLVRGTIEDKRGGLLRAHLPSALREATGLLSERRRQRAEALGSVLRSIASATIFAVAVMLVLGELGINLAPILASAGIAGIAIGFGAQNQVKDLIAGLFMLLEDQ